MALNTQALIERPLADLASAGRRGTLMMAASRVSGMAIGLASSAVMGRLLSPEDYGLVAMAMSVMLLLNMLKDFGLTTAVVQHEQLNAHQLDAVFWVNLIVALVFAGLGAVAAPWVAAFYRQAAIEQIIYALCGGLLLVSASGTHAGMLRRQLHFGALMWSEMAGQFFGLVAGVGLAWWTGSYWAIVASQLASSLATTVVLFWALPWRPGRPTDFSGVKTLLGFGANLSVFSLLNFFSNQLGAILTGAWLGAQAAGHFNRAQQLLNLSGNTLMSPITQTTLPVLSRMQSDPEAYRRYYTQLLQRTGMFFGLLGAFVIVTGDAVTRVLMGPQWELAGHMYRWFGLSIIAVGLASQTGNLLLSQSRSSELRHWGFGDATIRAGASAAGVAIGALGVAAAFGVSTLFVTVPIVFWLVGRAGPVPVHALWSAAAPGLFSAAAVALLGLGVRQFQWPQSPFWALGTGTALTLLGALASGLLVPQIRQLWSGIALDVRQTLARRPTSATTSA